MFLNKLVLILVATCLFRERFTAAQMPMLKTSFEILGANNYMDSFGKKIMNQLLNDYIEQQKIEEQNEEKRKKIYKERLLDQIRSAVFRDFYNNRF